MVNDMEYEYDPETDILLLKLRDETPAFGEQEDNIITHYNKNNKPVEIEILNASETAISMLKAMFSQKTPVEA